MFCPAIFLTITFPPELVMTPLLVDTHFLVRRHFGLKISDKYYTAAIAVNVKNQKYITYEIYFIFIIAVHCLPVNGCVADAGDGGEHACPIDLLLGFLTVRRTFDYEFWEIDLSRSDIALYGWNNC